MAIIKTVNFLPEIFRTETNSKFLNATLDQLVNEPQFTRVNGYIGRKFSPTYKSTDNYIDEVSKPRQNYQLEPSVVVTNKDTDSVDFYSSYLDLLQQIQYYGGNITNQNRLFNNESYSFDPQIDYDKFINFKNYYWLENGPSAVNVSSGNVLTSNDYTVTRNLTLTGYNFSDTGVESNPVLVLARGGQYTFNISEPGHKFWIQTEPGTSGSRKQQPNISTREIFGVVNNGSDDGTITFNVPLVSAQNRYSLMPVIDQIDIASVSLHYNEIQGSSLATFLRRYPDGIDGAKTFASLHNRSMIFATTDDVLDDTYWTNNEFFDMLKYGMAVENQVVPNAQRRNLWRITLVPSSEINPETGLADDYIFNLIPSTEINYDEKVYVKNGIVAGTKEYFLDFDNVYHEVPVITSTLDVLYYQDEKDPAYFGEIRIVESNNFSIDVNSSILNKVNYTSPNGVVFTNGLKIKFDSKVAPSDYANNEYYVEGVGKGISLIRVDSLVTPEPYAADGLGTADYVTINRGSLDLNGWTRSNRWFHVDVINQSSQYNKDILTYEYSYDPLFNNAFVPYTESTIVSTIRSRVAIEDLKIEYQAGQIFYAYSENLFFRLEEDGSLVQLSNFRAKDTNIPDQELRAKRPIIEFVAGTKLFNFGHNAIDPVDFLDFTVKDAFSDIERSGSIYNNLTAYAKGDVVIKQTVVYGATKNVQSLPSDTTVWNKLFQLVPYDASRPYLKDERVTYNGAAYQALNYADVPPAPENLDELWFKLFDYVSYNPETSNTIAAGEVVDYGGYAYRAIDDIEQDPETSNLWEELFTLENGKTIIFANEADPEIRKQIYQIQLVQIAGEDTIHLEPVAVNQSLDPNIVVIVKDGINQSKNYWFDGDTWHDGQLKTGINQNPMFDVVDENGNSFANNSTYTDSKFVGTSIFQYAIGTGTNDLVLGFPIKYKNFNSVGDIEFATTFNSDTFEYIEGVDVTSLPISSGYLVNINNDLSVSYRNVWRKNVEATKQFQLLTYEFKNDGINYFEIDIIPDEVTTTPNLKVYINNTNVKREDFRLEMVGVKPCLVINPAKLTVGDKIDILIFAKTAISSIGYYEIPLNLDFNSENLTLDTLTLGQVKDHVAKLEENSNIIHESVGTFTSQRDIEYKENTGTILQHAYPLLYSNLFLTNERTNLIESVEFASREYIKFKNKFLELSSKIEDFSTKTIAEHFDDIISEINISKQSTFPFYKTDMIPYGTNKTVYDDVVINPNLKQFDLPTVFNDNASSNIAVLVYVNNIQLIKDKDYYFPQDRTAVIINDSFTLNAGDSVSIVEYHNTWGSYVPETPSKLGLYPKFEPTLFTDDTYVTATNVIQGHDGSITPAFNDYRDQLLLEFEKRIYNNIKVNYDDNIFDLYKFIPGFFRSTDYTEKEWKSVLNRSFLKWAGFNQVDYSINAGFQSNNAWTWNYRNQINRLDGSKLTGSWRSIYQSLFDTVRPHTHPWEMLGFSSEPSWWNDRYGEAPYTGGNLLLWEDLEAGYIHAGPRAGYNELYARPGLISIIPVDEYGQLKSPDKFITTGLERSTLDSSYEVGTVGPAEYSWRRSSDYPFAFQRTLALTNPAFYFGSLLNIKRYRYNAKLKQLVNNETLKRITPKEVVIPNSYNADGSINFVAGYLNWICDYLTYRGIECETELSNLLTNCKVQLSYKAGGYTGKQFINVLAEQSSPTSTNDSIIIPDENYRVILNKSTPVKKVVYSGVIVERTNNGFTISGYDLSNPYFTIIPSLANNNNHALNILDRRVVVYHDYQSRKINIPYGHEFRNIQQVADFLISYGRFLVGQGFLFNQYDGTLNDQRNWELSIKEFLAWEAQGWKDGNVLILSPTFDRIELNTPGATVDYISNVTNGNKVLNQNFAVVKSTEFTVNRQNNQFSLETLNGNTICLFEARLVQWEHILIFDNVTVFNDIIYLPELGNRQFRLKLVGNKTANWAGELNPAGFVYNSPDIESWMPHTDYKKGKIVEYKSKYYVSLRKLIGDAEFDLRDWQQVDRYSIKTGLLPNLAFNAQKFENIYDVDNAPIDETLQEFTAGLIGLRKRKYLDDLNLDFNSQVKFYQGFIKEKGTKNSVTALTSASFNNISSEIEMYEEWAIRVGEYGAIEADAQFEIELDETKFTNDPSAFNLLNGLEEATPGIIPIRATDLYRTTTKSFKRDVFFARDDDSDYSKDIATAGFVNLADIDATVFDMRNYNALNSYLKQLADGWKIWVAKDFDLNWNVYRLTSASASVVSINYEIDNVMSVDFDKAHRLSVGDVFCIKGFSDMYDGFYKVRTDGIDSGMRVMVDLYQNADFLKEARTIANDAMLFYMDSMRLDDPLLIDTIAPRRGWRNGDKVWVDSFDSSERWGVYEKSNPWNLLQELAAQPSDYIGNDGYGTNVKLNTNADLALVAAPEPADTSNPLSTSGAGKVSVFALLPDGNFVQTTKLVPTDYFDDANPAPLAEPTVGFGDSLSISDYVAVIGAPASNKVFVHSFRSDANTIPVQILRSPDVDAGQEFGTGLDISEDSQWIYIGAPGVGKVYAFLRNDQAPAQTNSIAVSTYQAGQTFTIPYTPYSDNSFVVKYDESRILVKDVDYTVSGNQLTILQGIPEEVTSIVVQQGVFYEHVDTIVAPVTLSNDADFGSKLITDVDGSELIISAPRATVGTVANAGKVFVYSRRFEFIKSNSNILTYRHTDDISSIADIFVGDTRLIRGIEYSYNPALKDITIDVSKLISVNFTSGLRIKITSKQFDLIDELTAPAEDLVTGAQYGYAIDTDQHAASIYISAPFYKTDSYQAGKVYRYIKPQRYYGTVTSPVSNPVLTPGDNLYINGFKVVLSGSTVISLSDDINGAQIPGVTSTVNNGYLTIVSSSKVERSKLFLSCADNGLLDTLDIGKYRFEQGIALTRSATTEAFGLSMRVTNDDKTLLIGNGNTQTRLDLVVDSNSTTFDNGSTEFIDNTFGSQVHTYQLLENELTNITNPGKHVFVQKFEVIKNRTFQAFGLALDIRQDKILISDFLDDNIVNNGGTVWVYDNPTGAEAWKLIRSEEEKVDINSLNRISVYNKKTNNIISNLDYIDPVKGKILGQAEQDIDLKVAFDPAYYSNNPGGNSVNVDTIRWGAEQVGTVWWDLSLVRYVDYEQGSLIYRLKNWGKLFPGSTIEICEWVESSVPPVDYDGDGEPKYTGEGSYVIKNDVDNATGILNKKYYFWVKNKNNSTTKGKNNSIVVLADMIENPHLQGIPYAALLARNSIGLYTINEFNSSSNLVLQVRYDNLRNNNTIHSEYELIQENNPASNIPEKIINKLVDSLAGADQSGRAVPDPRLLEQDRYGISIRPRQTMIKNRTDAIRNFVGAVNSVLINYPIRQQNTLTTLLSEQQYTADMYDFVVDIVDELQYIDVSELSAGYRVLVKTDTNNENLWSIWALDENKLFNLVRVQAYKTSLYWDYVDWYAAGYDSTIREDYTVQYEKDVKTLALVPAGSIIKVRYNNTGSFTFYRTKEFNNTEDLELIALGKGTVQLSSRLYDGNNYTLGFATDNFDNERFDMNPSVELRKIFEALTNDIYVGELKAEFNKLFFNLIEYILYTQNDVDWIFKTSFVSVVHQLRELEQYPSFVKDNQDYYIDYINEVKPYRTKIREYLISYAGKDTYYGNVTDFDLPAYYESTLGDFRSPSGEGLNDNILLSRSQYQEWVNNHALVLESIKVAQPGSGYTIPPVVKVFNSDGTETDIVAESRINVSTGEVTSIIIKSGTNVFTAAPLITLNGNGVGASASPVLINNKIRSVSTSIKFDRVAYNSNLIKWTSTQAITAGDIVYYKNNVYRAEASMNPSNIFDYRYFTQLNGDDAGHAIDRLVAYYVDPDGTTGEQLITELFSGHEYPGVRVTGLKFIDEANSNTYVDSYIQSTFLDTALGTRAEDINVDGGAYVDTYSSHAPEELVPGITYDAMVMSVWTRIVDSDNNLVSGPPLGYRVVHDISGSLPIVPTEWNINLTYNVGNYVIFDGNYYVCIANLTAIGNVTNLDPANDPVHWRLVWAEATAWDANQSYSKGQLISYNDKTWQAKVSFNVLGTVTDMVDLVVSPSNNQYDVYWVTNLANFYYWDGDSNWLPATADAWQLNKAYVRGAYVSYGGALYKAISGFRYKAQVDSYAELPTSIDEVSIGDIYYTVDDGNYWRWQGEEGELDWVSVGPTPYYQTSVWALQTAITETLGSTPLSQTIFWTAITLDDVNVRSFNSATSRNYYRISEENTTTLARDFALTDQTMYLEDASLLPDPDANRGLPGVVYVDGEIIYYYYKDLATNTVSQIRRGVSGTGASHFIPAGTRIDDLGPLQTLPRNSDEIDWLNSLSEFGFVEVGDFDYEGPGFGFAYNASYPDGEAPFDYNISVTSGTAPVTAQARFLSQRPAYNP